MARVIVASTPLQGHVQPVLAAAAGLVRRGHEVVVLTGMRFADAVADVGARFVQLPPEADYDDRNLEAFFPERAGLPAGPAQLEYDMKYVFGDPTRAQFHALRALLAGFPADVVLSDMLFMGSLALTLSAPAGRRPVTVSLGTTLPALMSEDAPPVGLGVPPVPGEEGRALYRAMNRQIEKALADTQWYLEQNFRAVGVELPGFIFNSLVTVPDHYLQLTAPGFEYPRRDLPGSFRYVGPLPSPPATEHVLPDWWPELDEEARPVVVVTQGSWANRDLTELVAPAVQALADENVLVVAATARPDGPADLGPVPDNVRVGGFLPFDLLLPYASVLVTNGGYGGVHTALGHGVPLVVAGGSEDKLEVAARVEWSGVGVSLGTGRPSPQALRRAVLRVLAEPGYHRRAEELERELAGYDAVEAIVGVVAAKA
ncbi:nucleotide disphospho-sugar-binding domain-containing protein [Streptomyces sp. NPDC026672]|uniref:glycosyltransferase n=1 Tax=unclassified Streptomyces TaxID=2593676 RepID=UPI0033DF6A9D